jgi:hypothetical protein
MKLLHVVAAGALLCGWGADGKPSETQTVVICIDPSAAAGMAGSLTVLRAQTQASQILSNAGVRLDWRTNKKSCPADGIDVILSNDTSPGAYPGAMAYTTPYDARRIVVFYDRTMKAVSPPEPWVLGYVLAHEITHDLQGISRHSKDGVMKEKWNRRDYVAMQRGTLAFAPDDIQLIRSGLRARTLRASRGAMQ